MFSHTEETSEKKFFAEVRIFSLNYYEFIRTLPIDTGKGDCK